MPLEITPPLGSQWGTANLFVWTPTPWDLEARLLVDIVAVCGFAWIDVIDVAGPTDFDNERQIFRVNIYDYFTPPGAIVILNYPIVYYDVFEYSHDELITNIILDVPEHILRPRD